MYQRAFACLICPLIDQCAETVCYVRALRGWRLPTAIRRGWAWNDGYPVTVSLAAVACVIHGSMFASPARIKSGSFTSSPGARARFHQVPVKVLRVII
jgi:hypothetical protein